MRERPLFWLVWHPLPRAHCLDRSVVRKARGDNSHIPQAKHTQSGEPHCIHTGELLRAHTHSRARGVCRDVRGTNEVNSLSAWGRALYPCINEEKCGSGSSFCTEGTLRLLILLLQASMTLYFLSNTREWKPVHHSFSLYVKKRKRQGFCLTFPHTGSERVHKWWEIWNE